MESHGFLRLEGKGLRARGLNKLLPLKKWGSKCCNTLCFNVLSSGVR